MTDRQLAGVCAEAAEHALAEFEHRFDEITQRASARFLARDWRGSFDDTRERLRLYSLILDSLTHRVRELLASRLNDRAVWMATKAAFSALIASSDRWEIGESFFNSLTRRVFATEGVNRKIEFVDTDFDSKPRSSPQISSIYSSGTLANLIFDLLPRHTDFAVEKWKNLQPAAEIAAQRLEKALPGATALELVKPVFYRGRGAYVVGRALSGEATIPIAFCLLHPDEAGITLDAFLAGEADLAILFSYTRAYFRVDAPWPFALVQWLHQLMPGKPRADLYNAIGYNRHAKTEFYRDFIRHLDQSDDCFVSAEGTRGMVMLVFTLPSYDAVFKLIRDRFDQPKESDRRDVMRRYKLVFEHDRAGRLIEAHEFEHLRIARRRFAPSLLKELTQNSSKTVRVEEDDVFIAHAYVERRVRPLNLFFRESSTEAAVAAACDYGESIKDLAASNIFPGDLLTKNFGVTRRGRVVFYDYDELCFLTDCHFRDLPQSRSYEEEMAAEPWFSVRESDVFPEEFLRFLAFPEEAKQALLAQYGEIFQAKFWQEMQREFRSGEMPEVFPYAVERRLNSATDAG